MPEATISPDQRTPTSPPALSPSRASDFQQCPLLYRFRVLDRLPERSSPAQVRGTLVHSVLERLFDEPAGMRTLSTARDLVARCWQVLVEADPTQVDVIADDGGETAWWRRVDNLLDSYFRLEDPTRLEPAARELLVETTLPSGVRLRGFVDRLDVAPNGMIRIVDYKTGKAPDPRFEASALFQMRFYALVVWHEREVIPAMLQLVYLGSGDLVRYEPTERDLVAVEHKSNALWSAIRDCAATDRWEPKTSRLCSWCAHQAVCPAFGGTPPQLPPERRQWLLSDDSTTTTATADPS